MRFRFAALLAVLAGLAVLFLGPSVASAAPTTTVSPTTGTRTETVAPPGGPASGAANPKAPSAPASASPKPGSVTVDVNGPNGKPSSSIVMLLALTVLSVAPALLLLCTSFTKIMVVLSLTRNALGLTTMPPNQVLAGLALFLSLFIMGPVMHQVYDTGAKPYLDGKVTATQAFNTGVKPLHKFMVSNTRKSEISTMTDLQKGAEKPKNPESVPLTTLIPAFVLSELRAAFIIGFVVFIPFLIIDMIVSASLMSMGMMMLPPVTISLPFKLLLFVLVNGWSLIATALVHSYH